MEGEGMPCMMVLPGQKRPRGRPPKVAAEQAETEAGLKTPKTKMQKMRATPSPPMAPGAGSAASSSTSAASSVYRTPDDVNAKYMCTVQEQLRTIKEHPLFANIQDLDPLTTDAEDLTMRATTAPMNLDTLSTSLQNFGVYEGGCNIFYLDFLYTPTPGVPSSYAKTMLAMNEYYSEPRAMPTKLVVGLPKSCTVDELKGAIKNPGLKRVSPEEPLNAFIWAIARDVRAGESSERLKDSISLHMCHQPCIITVAFAHHCFIQNPWVVLYCRVQRVR
jgi:hypothetical protein